MAETNTAIPTAVPPAPLENATHNEDGSLTARIVVLSGDTLWRGREGDFVIDLDSVSIHRDRLILDYDHNTSEVLGHVDEIAVEDGKLKATAHIYSVTPGDRASEVIQRIRHGTPYEISPTVIFGEGDAEESPEGVETIINNRRLIDAATIFKNVPVRGASVCPYATDKQTGILGLALERTGETTKERNESMDEEKKDNLTEETAENQYTASPDLEKMIAEFGLEKGVEYYRKGISYEDAQADDYAQLKAARLAAETEKKPEADVPPTEEPPVKKEEDTTGLKAIIDTLKAEVNALKASIRRGEPEPLTQTPPLEKKDNRPALWKYAESLGKK